MSAKLGSYCGFCSVLRRMKATNGSSFKWHFLSHLSRDELQGITKGLFWKRFGGKRIQKKNNAESTPGIAKKNQYIKKLTYKNQFYKFVLISLVWFVLSLFCKLLNVKPNKSGNKKINNKTQQETSQRTEEWSGKFISSLEKRRGGQAAEVGERGVQKRADGVPLQPCTTTTLKQQTQKY